MLFLLHNTAYILLNIVILPKEGRINNKPIFHLDYLSLCALLINSEEIGVYKVIKLKVINNDRFYISTLYSVLILFYDK